MDGGYFNVLCIYAINTTVLGICAGGVAGFAEPRDYLFS